LALVNAEGAIEFGMADKSIEIGPPVERQSPRDFHQRRNTSMLSMAGANGGIAAFHGTKILAFDCSSVLPAHGPWAHGAWDDQMKTLGPVVIWDRQCDSGGEKRQNR